MDHIKSAAIAFAVLAVTFSAPPASAMTLLPAVDSYVPLLEPLRVSPSVALTADRWTNEGSPLREIRWSSSDNREGDATGYGYAWDHGGGDGWRHGDWGDGGGDGWHNHEWGHDGHDEWDRDHGRDHDGDSHHHRWPSGGMPRPVPVPDALPLLLSGLGCVLLMGRRRRKGLTDDASQQ